MTDYLELRAALGTQQAGDADGPRHAWLQNISSMQGVLDKSGRIGRNQRLHRKNRRGGRTAVPSRGCCCSRTKRITTRRRSSRSAARQPASAGRSATRFPAAHTSIRRCASPGAATRCCRCPRRCRGSSRSAKIAVSARAQGYSSYGNQIGLATGIVDELYHDGYVAKRMEIGRGRRRCAARQTSSVQTPAPGDVVVLIGGGTGRDGCGGATGSSKSHSVSSIEELRRGGAEGKCARGAQAAKAVP